MIGSRNVRSFTALLAVAAVSACGGGGGGSSSVPPSGPAAPTPPGIIPSAVPIPSPSRSPIAASPLPSGAPVVLPSSAAAVPGSVTIGSNPSGLAVTIDGASAGTTPLIPSAVFGAHTIAFAAASGTAPYAVTISNTGSAPITVFYNQTADSSGKLSGGIATSSGRRSDRAAAGIAARAVAAASNRAAFAPRTVQVEYDVARLGGRGFTAVEAAHGAASAQTLVQSAARVTRALTFAGETDLDAALDALRAEPGVVSASRVGLRYPAASTSGGVYPNDSFFFSGPSGPNLDQWYLWLVDAQDAWGYGAGRAPIAVIDTGYDPQQPEVAGLVTVAETIVNLQRFPNAATDHDGHGTFLSGVAGAQTNNGAGFAGMAYNAPLQEYKIFADGSGAAQTTDEAAAIRDAVSNGAKVILLALQSSPANGPDPAERDAVAFALQNGVTVVAASGDDNGSALDDPAGYPGVISVGASIVNDAGTPGVVVAQGNGEAVAAYSNAGPGLGLVAPGGQGSGGDPDLLHWIENVYTTQPASGLPACASGTAPAACRILFTGTSPAAALVAGTASLMLTVNPALAPAQIAQLLYASTDDIRDAKQGHGRLNAQRAVALAANDAAPLPALPLPRAVQFVAFAYTNSGATLPVAPAIVDATYKSGVSVAQDGSFRIADVNPSSLPTGTTSYKIGVWLSLAGDGKVHAGDYFTSVSCTVTKSCSSSLTALSVARIAANATTLP